jgi:hypothetical protein
MATELRIKKLFEVTFFLFGCAILSLNCFIDIKSTYGAYLLRALLEAIEIFFLCLVFFFLVRYTKQENSLMYSKHRSSLVLYFSGTVLFLLVSLTVNILPYS